MLIRVQVTGVKEHRGVGKMGSEWQLIDVKMS